MNPGIYMLTILVFPVAAVIVFAMKYASSYAAAQAKIADETHMKSLVARNANQLLEIDIALKALADGQARQTQTLDSIHSMLREVG